MESRMVRSTRRRRSCPPGQILHVRIRRGTRKVRCITNREKSGNPGIGPLHKGDLSQFGYANVTSMTKGRRHLALASAVRAYGWLSLWRKLNAVYVYTRNTAPASSAVFKVDRDWVKAHYAPRA